MMICPKCDGKANRRTQPGYEHQAHCPTCRFIWDHSKADEGLVCRLAERIDELAAERDKARKRIPELLAKVKRQQALLALLRCDNERLKKENEKIVDTILPNCPTGPPESQARAWSLVWNTCVELGLLKYVGGDGTGLSRVTEWIRDQVTEAKRLREDVECAGRGWLIDIREAVPGSTIARLLVANRLMGHQVELFNETRNYLRKKYPDEALPIDNSELDAIRERMAQIKRDCGVPREVTAAKTEAPR